MAMNSSPGRIVRESIETPASRATGSSAPPGLEPTAAAICAIVQSIRSSADLVCLQKSGIALYFSFWHPTFPVVQKISTVRVVLFLCFRAGLTQARRASGMPSDLAGHDAIAPQSVSFMGTSPRKRKMRLPVDLLGLCLE